MITTMGKFGLRKKKSFTNVTVTFEEDGTQVEKRSRIRTRTRRRSEDTQQFRNAFKDFCLNANTVGVQGLAAQFATIRAETQPSEGKSKVAFEANPTKNRYKDVVCTDPTRVVLTWPNPGAGDYIHANWINDTDPPKKFICTQKELAGCKLSIKFVKTMDVEENMVQTTLELSVGNSEKHTVEHLQWKDWPDRGVPTVDLSSFRLLVRVKKLTPIAVHCSAGIGRTGTIVGLDVLYSKLRKGHATTLESVVRGIRNDRHGSVQTDVQYLFMHRILLAVAENKKIITISDVEKFVTDYDAFCKSKGYVG